MNADAPCYDIGSIFLAFELRLNVIRGTLIKSVGFTIYIVHRALLSI